MAKRGRPPKVAKKGPRQERLPEMDDPKIEALHNTALDYAEARDERQQIGVREIDLKKKLLDLMKAHKKTTYRYKGVEVKLVVEEETVKVRVKKEGDDE